MDSTRVTVHFPDGRIHRMTLGARYRFGRGVLAQLVIADDTLSRQAGEFHVVPAGVEISNLSTTHALEVLANGRVVRLPKRLNEHDPPSSLTVVHPTASVGSPAMHRGGRALTLRIEIPTGLQHLGLPTAPQREDGLETVRPLGLAPSTMYFASGLMLCMPWLTDPSRATPLPSAREIARAVLEVVNAHHILACFDEDEGIAIRSISQVQNHLRYLRSKLASSGLLPSDTKVTTQVLAEQLIALDIITADDLTLPQDPAWAAIQEMHWWKAPPRRERRR